MLSRSESREASLPPRVVPQGPASPLPHPPSPGERTGLPENSLKSSRMLPAAARAPRAHSHCLPSTASWCHGVQERRFTEASVHQASAHQPSKVSRFISNIQMDGGIQSGLWDHTAQMPIPAQYCLALSKSLHLSEPQFVHLISKMGALQGFLTWAHRCLRDPWKGWRGFHKRGWGKVTSLFQPTYN